MAEFEGINYFTQLQTNIEGAVNAMAEKMPAAEKQILEGLLEQLGKFDMQGGRVRKNVANLKKISEIRKELDKIISQSNYPELVKQYFSEYQESAKLVNTYFRSIVSGYTPESHLYKQVTKVFIENVADQLIGSGVDSAFKNGITNILQQHVTAGANTVELRKALTKYVQDDAKLARHATQVADDALHQYSREYTQSVSDDLGLKHYFYKGTKIESSRSFCTSKVGKYFTKEQVESWAAQSWSGKNPATTKANIGTFLGGYRCRHLLVPVTPSLYEAGDKG